MAQPPFRMDSYQVENADAPTGPRLIEASELDGSLRFTDTRIPGGINLHELAGLQQAQNTIVVSPNGPAASKDPFGDPITTIQAAVNLVPFGSDALNPWVILVAPGVYIEDVQIDKDYVSIVGLGAVTIRNQSANQSTIRVLQGPASTPRYVRFQNLRVENNQPAQACIDLSTAQYATGTITVASIPNIGDTFTVGGVTLTSVAIGAVVNPGEFELGATAIETAENMVQAILDPVNGLNNVVYAFNVGPVVTIRAFQPGVAGNTITLASSVPLVLVLSGITLTGGANTSGGSQVGLDRIEVVGCRLTPTAINGFQIRGQAINNVVVLDNDWSGSGTGTFCDLRDCASFTARGIVGARRFDLHYDNTAPELPVTLTSRYELRNVYADQPLASALVGVGSFTAFGCEFGETSLAGNRSHDFYACQIGDLQAGGGDVTLRRTSRGALIGVPGGTLFEDLVQGEVDFVASASESVTFQARPNDDYQVLLEPVDLIPAAFGDLPYVTNKTVTGFDIVFGAAQTVTVRWTLVQV